MVDWARVQELQNDLGVEDFDEITALFMEEVEDRLLQLTGGNTRDLADDLHFLKGSAANLGFETLRSTCERLETDAEDTGLSGLWDAYNTSKQAFLAGLKQRRAG